MLRSIRFVALGLSAVAAPTAGAQSPLTTLFSANIGGSVGGANYFDLTVNVGVDINQLDVNINAAAGLIGNVDFYVGPPGSTFAGNELAGLGAGPWPATPTASSAMVTSVAFDNPTVCPLLSNVTLQPGTYACMVVYNAPFVPAYTRGTFTASNNEMTITAGSATSAPASGANFTPRSWNGSIHYTTQGGFAQGVPFGIGCGGTGPEAVYEEFSAITNNLNDLQNSGFSLIWLGLPNEPYVLTPATSTFVVPTGAPAVFGDDEIQQIPLGFSMPTENGVITDIYVCSNGFVGLAPITNTGAGESVLEFLNDSPRIAGYWDDLDPSAATGNGVGTMHIEADPNLPGTLHVTWTDVTQFIATVGGGSGVADMNTFQITFESSGNISCNYLSMASTDAIVGYSPGGGIADPGSLDLSATIPGTLTLGTGVPGLELSQGARPIIGGPPASVDVTNFPPGSTAGAYLLSIGQGFAAGIPLGVIGADGCFLYSGGSLAQVTLTVSNPTETLLLGVPTPATGSFIGVNIAIQALVIAPGINPLNVVTSNGVRWTLNMM